MEVSYQGVTNLAVFIWKLLGVDVFFSDVFYSDVSEKDVFYWEVSWKVTNFIHDRTFL